MAEGLKLEIGADVKQAEQALKTLTKDVEASATKIDSSYKKTFNSVNNAIAKVPTAARPAIQAVSHLGDNIETLRAKLLARQQFLVTEKDISKIAILNAEIRGLQAEITRVGNIGKVGFDSLGNSVKKTEGALSGVTTGVTKTYGALRFLANIIPGLGIGSLIALLGQAVVSLFKTSQGFDEAAIKAAKFSQAIKDAKTNLTDFFGSDVDLNKLKNKLKLGDGAELIAANFQLDKTANDAIVTEANKQIDDVVDRIGHLRSNAGIFLSKKGRELLDLFPDDALIPDDLIDELKGQDKDIVQELKVLGTRLESLRKERDKAVQAGNLLDIQRQIDLRDALKKEQEKRIEDLKKFIDKAKQLADELRKIGFIQPEFSFFDTQSEQLEKARKVFDDFNAKRFRLDPKFFKIEPAFSMPPPDKVADELNSFQDGLQKGIIKLPPVEIPVTFSALEERNASIIRDFQLQMQQLGGVLKVPEGALQDPALFGELSQQVDDFIERLRVANIASDALSNTFQTFLQRVASGQAPIKAFFQALVQQIIQVTAQLAAAALKAFFLKLILGGATGGAASAGKGVLKGALNGFRAAGGPVTGGGTYVVGEKGPELFVPNVSGRIIPNNDLALSQLAASGGMQHVFVSGRLRGRDMVLQTARTGRSQRRLNG